MKRADLVDYLDDYLDISTGSDYGPNGLQVEGRDEIETVVTGVSACVELFDRAADLDADAVLVHHGLFWDGQPSTLVGFRARRVRTLIENDLNLLAYHLPLDRHGVLGNNVLAARAFGLVDLATFAANRGIDIGWHGRFEEPISAAELRRRTTEVFGQEPLMFPAGPDPARTLGIVAGGAQRDVYAAIDLGLDAFITGEVSEWVMNVVREAGIHYLSAGHYATERSGIRALGEHVAERFGLRVEFIDVPNPV
ncbi:MAG: Nif3-like dinuclear metal center hexameric protein [Acidobacteriota bacterium]